MSDKNSGAHEWLIEFEKVPMDLNAFTICLDKNLQSLNKNTIENPNPKMKIKKKV